MLSNASILRVDPLTGAAADGTPQFLTGEDLSGLVGFAFSVTTSQRIEIGAVIAEASLALSVLRAAWTPKVPTGQPRQGDRLVVKLDEGESDETVEIVYVKRNFKSGGLSHFELFLKVLGTEDE